MFLVITKRHLKIAGVCICCMVGVTTALFQGNPVYVESMAESTSITQSILVIDAGHGGVDGGAVSPDGTIESGLNLAIAQRLEQTCKLLGVPCIMTRSDDRSLHSDTAQTIRQQKVSDLENRVSFINAVEQGYLVSIHQNSLPTSPSTRGAQCFYNKVQGAEELATAMQAVFNQTINTQRPKTQNQISDSIYLMKHITAPGVIVECGFLSNTEDTLKLATPSHQQRLALSMVAGLSGQ